MKVLTKQTTGYETFSIAHFSFYFNLIYIFYVGVGQAVHTLAGASLEARRQLKVSALSFSSVASAFTHSLSSLPSNFHLIKQTNL